MIPPRLTRAQQVTTAESSRTTVRPPGAGLLTWGFASVSQTRFDLVCLTDSLNSYGCGFQYCFVPDDVVTCAALLLGRPVRGK